MVDKYFLVVEITLAVVAPRPTEDLFDIRVCPLLLAHLVEEIPGQMCSRGGERRAKSAIL
jgi:hypothetical protein